MRGFSQKITLEEADNIIGFFVENDYEIDTYIDALLDATFIYVGKSNLKIGRAKCREYLMILPVYLNEWSSELILAMTDSKRKFETEKAKWENESKEMSYVEK